MTMTISTHTSQILSDEYLNIGNHTAHLPPNILDYFQSPWLIIISVIIFIFCFLGLLANGAVIWILGFRMKRNSFTIYILNLAVADLGVLVIQICKQIYMLKAFLVGINFYLLYFISFIYFVMYNTSQLLLITISIDRCVSVLFPIWHRCHRPSKLSKVICVMLWVFSCILFGTQWLAILSFHALLFQLILNGLICYPAMIISTLTLLVKVHFRQYQQKWRRIFTATLLALLCFLVFRFPTSLLSVITYLLLKDLISELYSTSSRSHLLIFDKLFSWLPLLLILFMLSEVCVTINSSINPILYFLAGRTKKDQRRTSMKLLLQRVFTNEDDSRETAVENHL